MAQMVSGRVLFKVFGVPFTASAESWKFIPPKIVIGIVTAVLTLPDTPLGARIVWGGIFGVILVTILFLHIVGHILASKRVAPHMTEAHITPILIQTLYRNDLPEVAPQVHIVRSLGGPMMTFILGASGLLALGIVNNYAIAFFTGANFVLLAFVLLPFPTVDGEVIWREIRKLLNNR